MPEDSAGNSFETATSLNLTPNFQTFTSSLNPLDPQDYYSLSLSGKSSFNLSLSGLSANADIELLDRTGKVLQTSARPGTNLESLFTTLNAGSYYIKVDSGAETTTNYNLSLSATPNQTPNWDALTGFGNPKFETGVFTVGSSGQVSIDYLFDGGLYQGELGLFSLEGMDKFVPSSDEFFQEAARRALSDTELGHVVISDPLEGARFHGSFTWEGDFNAGEYQGVKTFSMRPGDEFGVMLVPNGRVQQVFDNPAIGGEVRPLFSLSTANPNDAFHVGQIADITGDGSTFVMEDLRVDGPSDKDYNDIIFQVRGAKGTAISLDQVIDPTHDWRGSELGQQLLDYAKSQNQPPEIVNPVKDFVLTLEHSSQSIDLSQVFKDRVGEALRYEIVAGNSNSLSLKLDSNQLQLTSLPQTGVTPVAIRAIDEAGNAVTHSWTVTTSTLSNESVQQLDAAVSELHQVIHQEAGGDLISGLSSATGEEAIANVETFLAQNPQITPLLTQPDSLSQLGISSEKVTTVNQLLQSPELAAQLGLSVSLQEALNQPDTGLLDPSQIDANDAIYLIPSDAPQPKVGFIDLTQGQHLEHVTQTFASVNPLASYDTLPVMRGNWAPLLVQFVDRLKASGETKGIVNLSFDLSQLDEIGQTTRYELTPQEQQALQYAKENNVLLLVAAGNTGGRMSALGAASQQYDNIITVGATNRWEQRADYSAYGQELSLMAPGGEWQNNPNAFVGTSKSTAYVTAAASLVWAANPGLSYQQVKQLLLETAVDLDAAGWDAQTGAGLLDVSEAIRRALLTEPNSPLFPSLPFSSSPFSGEGRVQTLVRPTSENTEKAITQLQDTQQTLFDQWQVLSELGNPSRTSSRYAITLSDLESEVGQKTDSAFNTYQQVSTQAAITAAQEQQWTEALTLATNHYQIEQTRLQALEARKKELEEKLAGLGQEKTALEAETQQLLTGIQKQIDQAEKDLATTQAKLLNPFTNFAESLKTLPKDPEGLRKAAAQQLQLVQFYQQQAKGFEAEKERYAGSAKSYEANSWQQQILGYQPTVSGKQKALLGWGQDPQKLKLRDGNLWQAEIAEQNRLAVEHLAQQTEQQATALIQYAQFLESRTNSLDSGDANINDAENVLKFLQEQAAEQEALAQNYWKEVSIAEQRRQDNQAKADWHNAQIRKWQVVGTKRKGSGKREDVWGWAYYPEHIPARDQAQQLANQALQERQVYEQWARQAQQQADVLKAQAEKLRTSVKDWPVLKLGIDYEITADRWRLQADRDLLALHTPDRQQKLETLNLTIAQTEAELQTLQSEKLPAQTALTDATKNRLEATESELLAIQQQRTTALHDLQNFLETAGFLLPYKERLAAIAKQIQQLEADKLQVRTAIQQLNNQLIQTPNDTLRQQLNDWNGYLETLEQQLQYAQLQQDQLALAVADSPERLAITALIQELEKPETPNNLKSKIQNLKSFEGSGANFLQGFDNLSERLTQVKAEQAATAEALTTLQEEYRNLGLAKANLESNQTLAQQQQIAALEQKLIDKYRENELTQQYLEQVNDEVKRLSSRLDVLNRTGILEQKYEDGWKNWQQATQEQITATRALIATRQAGTPDREQLASLQSQLAQVQGRLDKARSLASSLADAQKNLELTNLQLGNQRLLLQSLIDQDAPLAAAEADAYNKALAHQGKIWYWNGQQWAENPTEAQQARYYIEQASFLADRRNKLWQSRQLTEKRIKELEQQASEQQSQINNKQAELAALAATIPQLEAQVSALQAAINTITQRLEPLQKQENSLIQAFQTAVTKAQNLANEIAKTTQQQAIAAQQLISFGILASESDVDFFATQVQSKVENLLSEMQKRGEDLTKQLEQLTQQIAGWEQELAKTTDEVSKKTLTDLIKQSKAQLKQLETWKTENQTATEELDKLLKQAIAALEPLRQKQELEIRQKLESNNTRLDALESQLRSENAADNLVKTGTVLAAAELTDQINQDLRDSVSTWTQQLQEGHQKTKQSGETQQKLSQSFDDLIDYIQNNFAEPQGQYNRTKANLRDDITSLGVIENRADEYDLSVTSTEQAIERIKLRIAQDAALWQEIAPIATRYGVESQQVQQALLQNYQKQIWQAGEQARQFEQQRQQYQATAGWWNGQINTNGLGFDEGYYLAQNPDVAAAVARGMFRNGYQHFLLWGQFEGRNPSAQFDNNYYLARNPDVAAAVAKGVLRSGVEHFVKYGQYEGRAHNSQAEANRDAAQAAANAAAQQRDASLQLLNDLKARGKEFLANYPDNGTAIDILQGETLEGSNPDSQVSKQLNETNPSVLLEVQDKEGVLEGSDPLQKLLAKAKAAQAEHEAQGNAAIAQADWYEREAAAAWERSRKSGPTWSEERCTRGRSGKRRCEWITHIDYDWILWDNYRQLVPQLRQKGAEELAEADKWRKEKERLEPLAKQWTQANEAANKAETPIQEARNFVEEQTAKRESIPGEKIQLKQLEELLPTLKQQLEQARQEAQARNAKVQQEWTDYDSNSQEYRQAVADVLQRRGELNQQAIEAQQQLAENERWVERQSVALGTELESTKLLATNLQQQRQDIDNQIRDLVKQDVTVDGLDDLYSKGAQLDRSLQLVTNKAAVLTAQQTALTQKRTLLTAQNEVILAEQRLLDAYIKDPDADFSTLQQQLQDTRAALAEAQRLAEQAEAASNALSAPLQQLQTDLLAQNDEHLKAAKEQQRILKALLEKTQLNANFTLQAAQKQREVNDLEFQILTRLQQAADAGYQEAKYLLDVAHYNGVATAAEIYYRDYSDLASDKGGGCTKGVARPEDRTLADQYYRQMLEQRELQRRAQEQASYFGQIKDTAQAQIKTLQKEQEDAAKLLSDLNNKIAATQEEMATKQQELAIAQARLDGITRIREQTEQTFIQLVTLEKLNLAQAQLEQEIAQQRQAEIEQAVKDRMERDRLELERQRKETTAKIEQLRQLQAEDNLRQAVNGVRGQLGMTTLDPTEDPVQLQSQLAGLLSNLKDLESQQPDLPADVKALLAEARKDINLALQGKEASTIQTNLLNAMGGLIGQIEQYKAEINRIDLEEQLDSQVLQTAQQNLQGASQDLLKELERSKVLGDEHDVIDPLYLEALTKAAYAQQAVDITNELGQQAKEALEQIIKQRVAQRKARKKSFWQKLLGIVSGVISILGTILSFTPLAPLGIALTAASAGINAIQSIINGDWLGGIFSIVMAGVNALTAGMGNVLSQGAKLAIQGLQSVATGAFNGVRSLVSGDSILGFLQILSGVAGAVTSGLENLMGQASGIMNSIFKSLQSVPLQIYGAIQAIKTGDWFNAISSIFNSVISLGTSFAGLFNDTAVKVFEYLGKIGNTGLAIGGAIKDGTIEGWLSGINSIIGMWGSDIMNLIDRLKGEPIDPILLEEAQSSCEN